jgi:hypothetical protein
MIPRIVGPGDVLAVWTGDELIERAIRMAELMEGKPAVANHVVIVTHQDPLGRWMGIEGRPGGVGTCDVTPYLTDARTRSNHSQPRPDDAGQVVTFIASCAKSLGIAYDWVGIAEDGLGALHIADLSAVINPLWASHEGLLPGHVVCSSLAAYLYAMVTDWAHPDVGAERTCEPADWWRWADTSAWL